MHSQIGNASPTYCTGVGKAALSTLEDETCANFWPRRVFKKHTPTTLVSIEAVIAELHDIRRDG